VVNVKQPSPHLVLNNPLPEPPPDLSEQPLPPIFRHFQKRNLPQLAADVSHSLSPQQALYLITIKSVPSNTDTYQETPQQATESASQNPESYTSGGGIRPLSLPEAFHTASHTTKRHQSNDRHHT
jgi:hypothetical protein